MNPIWIVVANQAEAQIYSAKRIPGNLNPVRTMTHEAGAAHTRDLTSDAPGRVHDRMGSARHSMEPETGVKEEELRRFVKEFVGRLEVARVKGDFEKLVLIAAPSVLGAIRKIMGADLARTVVKAVPKNVVGQSLDKIQEQLERSFKLK